MNIFAIETATPACAMAVRTDSGDELAMVVDDERHHTEALAAGIRDLLYKVGVSAASIDRVIVDRGPGLYTGLRVGIATALGFAVGGGAELVGVTSLEVLAHGAFAAGVRGALVSLVDGRRGEVFAQNFLLDTAVWALSEPKVAVPHEVVLEWSQRDDDVTFTGDGAVRYAEEFRALANASNFDQRVPPPLAALALGAGRTPETGIVPLYLREADAVANFSTRTRPP